SRHERIEDELSAQASFLESLVESMGAIASTLDPDQVLEQARREAEQLFGARGRLLPPGEEAPETNGNVAAIPLPARSREIRSLRDLSFSLEPVVLRDQGFGTAVSALAESVGLSNRIQIDVDVAAAEALADKAQVALYQIIREALNQAIRRGPPTRMSVTIRARDEGGYEAIVADDAPGERRRASFEAIAERVRTLHGRLAVEQGEG